MWTRSLRVLADSLLEIELGFTKRPQPIITSFLSTAAKKSKTFKPQDVEKSNASSRGGQQKNKWATTNKNRSDNIIRISSMNSQGGAYRKFRVAAPATTTTRGEDKFEEYRKGLSDTIDPEDLEKQDEDLELYSRSEQAYHTHVIEEDMRARRRAKTAIIKKKISKIEGSGDEHDMKVNPNLLTWDAKEQIKHLNNIDPGSR